MNKFASAALGSLLVALAPVSAAHAVDYGVHIYMSAPHVQGSPLTSNYTTETFDGYSTGACPASLTIGDVTGSCGVTTADDYGGASTASATPTTGGSGTKYATTNGGSNLITISLRAPAKYLGFWWSAGSPTNTVTFYSNGEEVAQMTTSALMTLLSNPTQTAIDGTTTYTSTNYNGNPVNSLAPSEPFVYLGVYSVGGTTFDSFTLEGGGFEFDNITVSDLEQTPDSSLVDVEFIEGLVPPSDSSSGGSEGGSGGGHDGKLAATGFNVTLGSLAAVTFIASGVALVRRRARS